MAIELTYNRVFALVLIFFIVIEKMGNLYADY